MKFAKILIVLSFILAFAFSVSAQNNIKNNKSDGSVFTLKEKLEKLTLLVSTEKDVEKIFGKKCRKYCFYKGNWGIYFNYRQEFLYTFEASTGKRIIYKSQSNEFFGKLLTVSVIKYGNVPLTDSYIYSKNLKCLKYVTYPAKLNTQICSDNQGLAYFVYDEITRDGKSYKNVLANIYFSLPEEKYNEIIGNPKQ